MSSLSPFPEATSLNTIFKHSIMDGQGSIGSFKAQFLGRKNIEIVKKKWWLLFVRYRGTKTINPSGLFENFGQLTLSY